MVQFYFTRSYKNRLGKVAKARWRNDFRLIQIYKIWLILLVLSGANHIVVNYLYWFFV